MKARAKSSSRQPCWPMWRLVGWNSECTQPNGATVATGRAGLGGLGDPVERVLDVVRVLPPLGLAEPFEMLQGPGRQRAQPVLVEDGQGGSRTGAVQDHGRGGAVEVVGLADGRVRGPP